MTAVAKSTRVEGIDVARALASLIMVQGHAYEMYVHPSHHQTASYRFTRLLGTLPLPSFLMLAGAALYMRVLAAEAKHEDPNEVRRALSERGLQIVFIGYAMQIVFGFVDGQITASHIAWDEILRADVLQSIGLSIVVASQLGLRWCNGVQARTFAARTFLLALFALAISVPVNRFSQSLQGVYVYAMAPWMDVGAPTRMPLIPLLFWVGSGVALAAALAYANRTACSAAGAPTKVLMLLGVCGLLLATLGTYVESLCVASGMEFSRLSWVILPNGIQLLGRAMVVLALGALSTLILPTAIKPYLVRIGQNSLVVYLVHMPLCFSALAHPLKARFDMATGTVAVIALYVVTISLTLAWARYKSGKPLPSTPT